jgi:hypothetical protein
MDTTTGQKLTAALRSYLSIGTRTRRHRKDCYGYRVDLHREMIDAITNAAQFPGYYSESTQNALRVGFGVALAYGKHVQGYRIDGTLAQRINAMSAWQFAALLGQMVDAEVETAGDGERFFSKMR